MTDTDRKLAEEILQKHGGIRGIYDKDIVIDAMLEFASLPVVTDKEIKDKARIYANNCEFKSNFPHDWQSSNEGYIDGFKACLSRFQPSGKTEQLNSNFMQVMHQTLEEEKAMYMRLPKEELITMLIECQRVLGLKGEDVPNVTTITSTTYPYDIPSDEEKTKEE